MASKRSQTAAKKVPDAEPVNLPTAEEVAADKSATETYRVTELAGPRVAGQRVKRDQELQLTEEEARAYLVNGALELSEGA